MDEDGVDSGDLRVDLFDLLRGDVLSLRQLEDVLGSVDDLEGSVGQQLTDVSTVHESVLVDALVSLGLVLVVAQENGMSSQADLSSWVGVSGKIFHFWDVNKLELQGANGSSDSS